MKLNLPYESLLSEPGTNVPEGKIERPLGSTVEVAKEFVAATTRYKDDPASRKFARQYAHAYAVRLWATRPLLEEQVEAQWGGLGGVKKIAELCESSSASNPTLQQKKDDAAAAGKSNAKAGGSPMKKSRNSDDHEQHIAMREDIVVAVIGTVFKQQPEKPSILQELVEDNPMIPVQAKTRFISEKDIILLEDETTRVQLVVSTEVCGMTVDGLVNGIVCAVKGKPTINGKFEVHDVIYATPKPSVWPEPRSSDAEMVFVSGLLLGRNKKNLALLELLFDYLQGVSGCPDEHENSLKMKTRVFFLGDSFGLSNSTEDDDNAEKVDRTEVAKRLDEIFDQISQTMEVFVIPGKTDPSEPMFPQVPLHRCILPLSSRRPTFHSICNPTRLQIPVTSVQEKPSKSKGKSTNLDVILASGQSVKDAMRNTNIDDSLHMCVKLLQWGHLCPTAPDTLALHPGIQDDVFVLKSLPNLFIVGNQEKFGTKDWHGTRVVTVPIFSDTGIAVILNKNLDVMPLNIMMT